MFNNVALDVVIGLVFVYLLYSLLATIIQEIIATKIGLRAIVLKQAIGRMLDDDGLTVGKKKKLLAKKDKEIEESLRLDKDRESLLKQIEERKEQQKKLSNEQPPNNDEDEIAKFNTQLAELKKREDEKTKEFSELAPSKTASLKKERDELEKNLTKTMLSQAFYSHPLIKYLAADSSFLKDIPSYIDPETFSKVVIDLLRGQNIAVGSSDRQPIQTSLTCGKIEWDRNVSIEPETLTYLRSIWADSQGDVIKFKANLEQWFNEMMDRATGWYKKYTQLILLAVGIVIAGAFNIDTIKIANQLEKDPALREQVVTQASNYIKAHPNIDKEIADLSNKVDMAKDPKEKSDLKSQLNGDKSAKTLGDQLYKNATKQVIDDVNSLGKTLALGWGGKCEDNLGLSTIPGWILTALAISMGAPFWFDLLNKLVQLRSSVAPKDDSKAKLNTATPTPKNIVG